MSFTDAERKSLLKIVKGITFAVNGEPILPASMTPEEVAHGVNFVGGLKKEKLLRYNFLQGAMISKIPKTRAARTQFCVNEFGRDRAAAMMSLAWVFEAWGWNQNVPKWGWSHYHESAAATPQMKREFVERNARCIEETGKPLAVKILREECARMKALAKALLPFETNGTDPNKMHSTVTCTYIIVERKEGRYQADTETGYVTPLCGAPPLPDSQYKALGAYARTCPPVEETDEES